MKKIFACMTFAVLLVTTFSISGCLPRRPGEPPHHGSRPHHPPHP